MVTDTTDPGLVRKLERRIEQLERLMEFKPLATQWYDESFLPRIKRDRPGAL